MSSWPKKYKLLIDFLDKFDPKRRFKFRGSAISNFMKVKSEFENSFILEEFQDEVSEAERWIKELNKLKNTVTKSYNIDGIIFSREFGSFLEGLIPHFKRKMFLKLHDLMRGKLTLDDFESWARKALTTCFRTNMRTLYQSWGFLAILKHLADYSGRIVYPEYGYLPLERFGMQRVGRIPPNCVVKIASKNSHSKLLSFFIEAPRPLGWGSSEDLQKVWGLYTAMRPDLMVYNSSVMDIIEPLHNPPIKRPNFIVEFKELDGWFFRRREILPPETSPLTAEEWRSRWIKGLYDGLAEAIGLKVKGKRKISSREKRKFLRFFDYEIVASYCKVYKPDKMFLISRVKVLDDIRRKLEDDGVVVLDNVEFNIDKLKPVVEEFLR